MILQTLLVMAILGGDVPNLQNSAPLVKTQLAHLPGVKSVEIAHPRSEPKQRIVHLLNWHYVSEASFAVDIRSQSSEPISDEEIGKQYADFLDEVEAVQQEQTNLLRAMIKQHGINRVYCEGFSRDDLPAYKKRIERLKRFEKFKPKGNSPIEQLVLDVYRSDLLELVQQGD